MQDNQIYRVTYEAFSKFSNSLVRCRTFEEVAAVLKVNLKYLFNFHVIRVSYAWEDQVIHFTVSARECSLQVLRHGKYLSHEQALLEKLLPMHWKDIKELQLPDEYALPEEEGAELWGWVFKSENRQIVISLLSGRSKLFSGHDVTFVRLMAENLESKLLELCLFQALDKKNEVISTINRQQQETIELRTREIAAKNQRLLEISVLNAHQVREPLSRILGLVKLAGYLKSTEELREQLLPRLQQSSEDLDMALRDIIDKATGELKA